MDTNRLSTSDILLKLNQTSREPKENDNALTIGTCVAGDATAGNSAFDQKQIYESMLGSKKSNKASKKESSKSLQKLKKKPTRFGQKVESSDSDDDKIKLTNYMQEFN